MELPRELVTHIQEYARPFTRSDWRHLHKYTLPQFNMDLHQAYHKTFVRNYAYYYSNEHDVIRPSQYRLFRRLIE
jgi:hypothetical protein